MELADDLVEAEATASWCPKVKEALTVPLDTLRKLAKKRREIEAILEVSVAAAEMDLAVEVYLDLLQQTLCEQSVDGELTASVDPLHAAVIPLVNELSHSLEQRLGKAERLLIESQARLANTQNVLKTFADDNRATAEEMRADGIDGALLANKTQLAQIEELLVDRIQCILKGRASEVFPLKPWPCPSVKRHRTSSMEVDGHPTPAPAVQSANRQHKRLRPSSTEVPALRSTPPSEDRIRTSEFSRGRIMGSNHETPVAHSGAGGREQGELSGARSSGATTLWPSNGSGGQVPSPHGAKPNK